jgi:hypothetical protein
VGENTIPRGEENRSVERRPPPNLLVKTLVLKNIKTKTIINKTNTNNMKYKDRGMPPISAKFIVFNQTFPSR